MSLPRGYVYVVGPIDYWPAWISIDTPPVEDYPVGKYAEARHALLEHAKRRFHEAGWEGDIRMGPFFAGLPTSDITGVVMVGLKQDNNGTTFIWSPYALPWLWEWQA